MAAVKDSDEKSEGRRIYITGEFNEEKSEKVVTSLLDINGGPQATGF